MKKAGQLPDLLPVPGGDDGDRTHDLGVANAALSQLSYIPVLDALSGAVCYFATSVAKVNGRGRFTKKRD